MCCIVFLVSWLYKEHIGLIKYVLFLQIVQMQISNFKVYKSNCEAGLYDNYEGLNMLSAVFSVIFTIFNSLLLSFMIKNKNYVRLMLAIVYTM